MGASRVLVTCVSVGKFIKLYIMYYILLIMYSRVYILCFNEKFKIYFKMLFEDPSSRCPCWDGLGKGLV